MKERPILFSAPMVRALLAGTKTQTRRIVKPQPVRSTILSGWRWDKVGIGWAYDATPHRTCLRFCSYGQPGDRLWVRETWCKLWPEHAMSDPDAGRYYYAATDRTPVLCDGDGFTDYTKGGKERSPWKPSIHMPRAASRLTLEITGVGVERLQEISDQDCLAEGVASSAVESFRHAGADRPPAHAYRELWESINGHGSWDANPWVWAITFKKVTP